MYCLKRTIAISLLAASVSLSTPCLSQSIGASYLIDNSSPAWFLNQAKPETIVVNGKAITYMAQFNNQLAQDKFGWTTNFQIMRPGLYQFIVYPKGSDNPFSPQVRRLMEPVYGQNGDWPKYQEMQNQIFPMTPAFGQAAGGKFSALVVLNGKPAANTVVAVEYYGADNYKGASATTKIITLLRTNKDGEIDFTIPWEGWWGFVAINNANSLTVSKDGSPIELGSVLWTKFVKQ